jgi:mono/diheme cytochrome c family protein
MPRSHAVAVLALAAAILVALPETSGASGAGRHVPARAQRGLIFVQQHCAACHAVGANAVSPNPESPPFEDVANKPGLTLTTLRQFLSDSHNYPQAMNFTVERARIRDIAAYMLTLRKPGYRPQP